MPSVLCNYSFVPVRRGVSCHALIMAQPQAAYSYPPQASSGVLWGGSLLFWSCLWLLSSAGSN